MTGKQLVKAIKIGIGIFVSLIAVAAIADWATSESAEVRAARQAQAAAERAQREAHARRAVEDAAARFSPEVFAKALNAIDTSRKQKNWQLVWSEVQARHAELQPILKSSRGSEPAILKLKDALGVKQTTVAAALEREREQQKQASTLTAQQVFGAYERNQIEADRVMKGQRIRVRGRIHNIGTDILNTPYVSFDADAGFFTVQAMFDKGDESKLTALRAGQIAAVSCVVDGKLGNVILRQCALD